MARRFYHRGFLCGFMPFSVGLECILYVKVSPTRISAELAIEESAPGTER